VDVGKRPLLAQVKAAALCELELVAEGRHYSYGFEVTAQQITAEWLFEIDAAGEERPLFEREADDGAPRITIGNALATDSKRRGFLEFVACSSSSSSPVPERPPPGHSSSSPPTTPISSIAAS
jgi:hypothetical protein